MSNETIRNILTAHNIDSIITKDGRIFGFMPYTQDGQSFIEKEELTGYTKSQVKAYLGY